MDEHPPGQEDREIGGSDESNAELLPTLDVLSHYVDQAEVHVQPFTVHLILGANAPDGKNRPLVHLTMSPHFAAFLKDALTRAVAVYNSSGGQTDRTDELETG